MLLLKSWKKSILFKWKGGTNNNSWFYLLFSIVSIVFLKSKFELLRCFNDVPRRLNSIIFIGWRQKRGNRSIKGTDRPNFNDWKKIPAGCIMVLASMFRFSIACTCRWHLIAISVESVKWHLVVYGCQLSGHSWSDSVVGIFLWKNLSGVSISW